MDIPVDIRKKAMDAVFDRETTAYMRARGFKDTPPFFLPALRAGDAATTQPLTESAKRQAMDATAHPATQAQITLMRETGPVHAQTTPSRTAPHTAHRVSNLHRAGIGTDAVHHHVTKDSFDLHP